MGEQALTGLHVLDVGMGIAGPYCCKLLGDYGAAVIKVEAPGSGDPARQNGPFPGDVPHPEASGLFSYLNANKKGVTLNIGCATGAMLFRRLVAKTDVLVENFAPKVMTEWGLGYETLEKMNPGLVMTSISPFGQTGPYRDYAGGDLVEQAMGGWMYAGGTMDREPLKAGGSLSDYLGGLSGAVATLTAVLARKGGSNGGQHVDVSIQESMVIAQAYLLLAQSYRGLTLPRMGSPFPFTILPCKDGYIGVNILTHGQWTLLCQFMGVPELIDNPNYQDGMSRLLFGKEITDVLRPRLMEKTKEELFYEGQSWRIPFCLIPTTEELLAFEQHKEREFFVEVDHPEAGTVRQPGAPFKMTATPWQRKSPAPLLGQHNEEVYCSYLGLGKEDLVRLRREGVI